MVRRKNLKSSIIKFNFIKTSATTTTTIALWKIEFYLKTFYSISDEIIVEYNLKAIFYTIKSIYRIFIFIYINLYKFVFNEFLFILDIILV